MSHILCWNCRGFGEPPAINNLRGILSTENPLVFDGILAVSCIGEGRQRSGGLVLLWKNSLDISVQSYSVNHMDVLVNNHILGGYIFTGIYGYLKDESNHMDSLDKSKYKIGVLLEALKGNQQVPWLFGGVFNLMLMSSEKKGGNDFTVIDANILRKAISVCKINDMGYVRAKNLQARLDCFLANNIWKNSFLGSFVTHLAKRKFDHLSILITMKRYPNVEKGKQWRKLLDLNGEVIAQPWGLVGDFLAKLSRIVVSLTTWSKATFGGFTKEIRECKKAMLKLMEEPQTEEVIGQVRALDNWMDEVKGREEAYWKQRSRQEWLKNGDQN
ncbi:26S proteasome regulatory subunit 6A-like protein B [Bienertia sinuspersici]